MKLVFISNFFNHHQKFVSDVFYRECASYYFVSAEEMPEERKQLGYASLQAPYLIGAADLNNDILKNCDAVVIGSAPSQLIQSIKRDKLIFYYSERPLKQGNSPLKYLYRFFRWRKRDFGVRQLYMLCASAYAAADYAKFHLYKNCSYQWGYFPEAKAYAPEELFKKKHSSEILWCGRFLDWKHPDDALYAAKKLKDSGCRFRLTFIGTGEMEQALHRLTEELGLTEVVQFTGALSPEQVRQKMEQSGVFLLTSDHQEGWGAVLNEAMNAGCAVVASHAAGAVPVMVKHRQNGWIYPSGNIDALCRGIRYFLEHPEQQKMMGMQAYHSITDTWNAEVAAKRLIQLSEHILQGERFPDLYAEGPCSKAQMIKDDWFKDEEVID